MQICKNSRRDFNYSLQYALYSGDKNHLWYLNCWWSFEIEFKMVFALVKKFVVLNLAGAWIDNGILVLVVVVTVTYMNYAVNRMMNL